MENMRTWPSLKRQHEQKTAMMPFHLIWDPCQFFPTCQFFSCTDWSYPCGCIQEVFSNSLKNERGKGRNSWPSKDRLKYTLNSSLIRGIVMKVIFSKQTSCGPNKDSEVKYVKIWESCLQNVFAAIVLWSYVCLVHVGMLSQGYTTAVYCLLRSALFYPSSMGNWMTRDSCLLFLLTLHLILQGGKNHDSDYFSNSEIITWQSISSNKGNLKTF